MDSTSNWNRAFELSGAGDPAGLIAGVARPATQLALSQVASYNVIRVLAVAHTLNLTQSEYFVESVSSTLALTHSAPYDNHRPRSVTSDLILSHEVSVSGGRTALATVLEIIADGDVLEGQAIYIKSSGNAAVADADDTATEASVAGLAAEDGGGTPNGSLRYRTDGHLTLADWTSATGAADLTPGAPYYLSTTAGDITATPPTGDGEWVVKVGRAQDERTLAIELGEGTAL